MKINKINTIYTLVIILLVLMDCNFFYFVKPPSNLSRFWGTYAKFLLVAIAVLLFVWSNAWKNTHVFLKRYFIGLTISFVAISGISVLVYDGERFYNHLFVYGGVFLVILAFPLLKFFRRQEGYEAFLSILNIISFIIYMLFVGESFLYKSSGHMILNVGHGVRNGNLRMGLSSISNVMVLYNFCKVFCSKAPKKYFNIIQLVLGLYCVFVIQQTRAYYICFCVCFTVVLLLTSENRLKTLRNIGVIIGVVIIVVHSGILSQFLDTFSETSAEAAGNIARSGAFSYFWNEFFRNPLWGHGFLTLDSNLTIKTGSTHLYYYADTGIIGLLAQMGLFIIPVYIWPMVHWGRNVLRNLKSIDPFLVSLYCYLLSTTPTLICTNPERVMLMPLCFALFAYSQEKSRV